MATILSLAGLSFKDQHHLEAAQGWLGLGNWKEANEELENISSQNRTHLEVLFVRFKINSVARKWEGAYEIARAISEAVPGASFGVFHMAVALHEMKRTEEAWELLLSVVDNFPNNAYMRYNLACYTCQLGKPQDAMTWLEKAIFMGAKFLNGAFTGPLEAAKMNPGNPNGTFSR